MTPQAGLTRRPPSGGQPPERRRRRAAAPGGGGTGTVRGVHDLTQARILRALDLRQRYTWVQPHVLPRAALAGGGAGWCVVSPNCSRSIDPAGGTIPIAWLEPALADGPAHQANGQGDQLRQAHPGTADPAATGRWHLHAFDHAGQAWVLQERSLPLGLALQRLQQDTDRCYWP